jgi:hypothetical protein
VTLLAAMQPHEAALSLLNLAMQGEPDKDAEAARGRRSTASGERTGSDSPRSPGPRAIDVDLRVDAVMIVARMAQDGDEPAAGKKPTDSASVASSAAALRDPRSVQLLVRLASSKEKQIRLAALYALARGASRLPAPSPRAIAGDLGVASAFESALFDAGASQALKIMAWLGLGELAATGRAFSPRVRSQLVSLLSRYRSSPETFDGADEPVLAAAVHALGRARDVASLPALIEILQAGNDEAQRQAAWALGALADARAHAALLRAVFNKREPVRRMAALALGQLAATEKSDKGDVGTGGRLDGGTLPPLPAVDMDASAAAELDGASLASKVASTGSFVERLLDASASLPKPVGEPLWQRDVAPLIAAVDEALLSHRDTALRALGDLLGSGDEPASPVAKLDPERGRLCLGPLAAALPTPLAVRLGSGLLPTLRRVALAQLPQAVGGQKPALHGELDIGLRLRAAALLGRLAALSDASLAQDAQGALQAVAKSESAELALLALEHAARALPTSDGAEGKGALQAISDETLTRFLASRERSARVLAIETAARLQTLDRGLVSAALLRRATADSDGYVREQAQSLLRAAR